MKRKTSKITVKGELFVVSAPSGAGKTTLCRKLTSIIPRLKHSVSYTTRAPRKGERNNVHYTFISENRFRTMLKKGEFAEWAVVHGNLYGTSSKRLKELRARGYDIILDIDTQGAMQIRREFADAVYIFILPPDMKVLEQRLKGRKSDISREIKRRLLNARKEIPSYKKYDYVVVNDDKKKALRDLESIITASRLRTAKVDSGFIKTLK